MLAVIEKTVSAAEYRVNAGGRNRQNQFYSSPEGSSIVLGAVTDRWNGSPAEDPGGNGKSWWSPGEVGRCGGEARRPAPTGVN